MPSIRIAAAQSISVPGDISANVAVHTRFIRAAHAVGVDVLVFPELSLCGYVLPRLRECGLRVDDERLEPIRSLARSNGMTIVVGAALQGESGALPSIAAFTYDRDDGGGVYCKQHLHAGEEQFATPGSSASALVAIGAEVCALAICADTAQASHAAAAHASGATLYLAGVLVSTGGYATDAANLQRYAAAHSMGVLMANHGAPSGGYASAGRSAFWAPDGKLVVAAPGDGSLLVVAQKQAGRWSGEVVAVAAE